jgi:hypothetical protein
MGVHFNWSCLHHQENNARVLLSAVLEANNDLLMQAQGVIAISKSSKIEVDEKYERDDERSTGAVHDTSSTREERDEGV